jgi:hypothetical protein
MCASPRSAQSAQPRNDTRALHAGGIPQVPAGICAGLSQRGSVRGGIDPEYSCLVNFWRTKSGLEVDFILGQGEVAIEVKGTSRIDNADLRPLKTFIQEYHPARAFVVGNEGASRVHEDIRILPWRDFLKMLWNGEVIS